MKKILNLLISSLLAFSLAACAPSISEPPENVPPETLEQTYHLDSKAQTSITDDEASDYPDERTNPAYNPDSHSSEIPPSQDEKSGPNATAPPPGSEPIAQKESVSADNEKVDEVEENGTYTSKEDVALYIHLYGRLPSNFITKKDAEALGWKGGSLEPFAPGMCIGGNRFGNYEGLLPDKDGRSYTECDIDTLGADKRGAKRIVFSNDGLIYYTEDHYESFELLYGQE